MLLQKYKNFYNNILFKGVHAERQVVKFAFEVGNRIQSEAVEINELVHEIPYFPTFSMEDMRTIFVNIDTLNISQYTFPPIWLRLSITRQLFPAWRAR